MNQMSQNYPKILIELKVKKKKKKKKQQQKKKKNNPLSTTLHLPK